MLKKTLVASLLFGLLAIPGALRAVQSVTGVPQDPAAVGYLNLHKRHPDGYEGPDEFNRVYSSEQALQRLTQIRGILESFRQLTEKTRGRLSQSELQAIGNTGDMQTIGFHNIPLIIEGTVLKQEYQLNQIKFQLAQLRRERAEITPQELDRAKTEYEDATKKLQMFWDTKLPTD